MPPIVKHPLNLCGWFLDCVVCLSTIRIRRDPDEFKILVVKQVIARGDSVPSVAERLGVSSNSIYHWLK
ncbi:transposase [Vibrio sp. 99-8-1]|nr:transposase [Vibrio sp. 99-8-1]